MFRHKFAYLRQYIIMGHPDGGIDIFLGWGSEIAEAILKMKQSIKIKEVFHFLGPVF